ncbi:MAG: ATP-binding protein [Bacteroidia bacterium]
MRGILIHLNERLTFKTNSMAATIDTEPKLDDLALVKYLKDLESPFLSIIQNVYDDVKDILNNRIQVIFPKYTLHNTGHSFRIIEYMNKLVDDPTKLDELEIALLICSALLHDVGMAASEEDINAIKADSFSFCDVKFSAMKKLVNGNEDLALQEYIRRIHAGLSGRYIREKLKDKLIIPKLTNLDFANELALICESHTQDYDWVKTNLSVYEVRGKYYFNSQYVACILRLADILDIDGNRTPYKLYQLIAPKGVSDEEWKQHFIISNTDKIIFNDRTRQKKIVFYGKVKNASTHRKILTYIDWVKIELTNSVALVTGMQPQYSLMYDTNPEINIQTEGYTFSDHKMTLQFEAISSLLMGEKIYGNRSLGLRELIQNSIDACRIREENEQAAYEFGQDKYIPKIKVILDPNKNQAIIQDNGIGMSMNIIKKHFLNIGISYYKSDDFLLKDFNYKPIGNFGIGFLSCFMLSDNVMVNTRHYKTKHKYRIELEKGNEWTPLTISEDVNFEGTEVILNYEHFIKVFDNKPEKVKEFLAKYFLTDDVDFKLINRPPIESIVEISNPVIFNGILDKGITKVDFQDYLNDIDGYVLIKNKKAFVETMEDLDLAGDLYKYTDGDGLTEITELAVLQIDDYINNKEIKYLSIPLVESDAEDDFLNGLQFTQDDVKEVIDKLDDKLRWISILVPKELQSNLNDETIDNNDLILDNLDFKGLVKIGHSDTCKTRIFVKTIKLFEGRKNQLYLPFDDEKKSSWHYLYNEKQRKELFIRGVLIKDFYFELPISASIFEITTIVANIKSRKFIPDISRNNFDDSTKPIINYIIGKAIHMAANNLLSLNTDEKLTLNNFINTYYDKQTEFEKIVL